MNIVSLIPARGGSKGVPGKNIKELGKKPLLAYSIQSSLQSKWINRTILSTDSSEIAEMGKKYGAEVPFLRPSEISQDNSTDYEFVDHAICWLEKNENYQMDYIIHLRPTTPLRDVSIMDKAIKTFVESKEQGLGYSALRSVHEMSESAYKCFEIDQKNNTLMQVFTQNKDLEVTSFARQTFPPTYVGNGYVDVLDVTFIKKHKTLHGSKVLSYITPVGHEVDTFDDFTYLEFIMHKTTKIVEEKQRGYEV